MEPDTPAPPQSPASAQQAAGPASADTPPDSRLEFDEFMRVELRAARVVSAERVPKSRKLMKLLVDLGSEQRTLVAGIAEAYEPDALVGRTVAVVANLKPATLMGIESNGMILAATGAGGLPILVGFEEPPSPGTRIK